MLIRWGTAMTRVKISAAILLILIAVSVISGIWVNKCCTEMIAETSEIAQHCMEGDIAAAQETAVMLENDWNSFNAIASVLLRNERLTEAERIVSRIGLMTGFDEKEVIPQTSELIKLLDTLRKGEIPCLNTIF